MIEIRDVERSDEAEWRRLWAGYLTFYETALTDDVTQATWNRFFDPTSAFNARVAVSDGALHGIANHVLHETSWCIAPSCYLEDLFVDPDARGAGIGKALIDDLIALARGRGWSRVYWHTHHENARARRLYDSYVPADPFVRYRVPMT